MAVNNNRKIKRKVRNAYIISTVSIALVLFLLGAVGYLILGALNASNRLKENVSVFVMLKDGIPEETSAAVKRQLETNPAIREVKFIPKDQAAADFQAYLGSDFVEFLQTNPLPDSYEVKLDGRSAETGALSALEKQVMSWDGVDEVVYQRNVIEQVTSNINKFNLVLLLFGGALLIISLILLNNTIRVTIFSKRYLIHTMKLVGATRWFITKPFLGGSILQGIYAGLISWAMLAVMIAGLHEGLPEVKFVSDQLQLLFIFGAMMVGGILISLVFTAFAVRKFLRMRTGFTMIAGRLRYILEHNRRRACRHKHGERMKKNEKNTTDAGKSNRMPLTFTNYKLMLIGFAVIVLGFILMSGGGSDDPNVFNEDMFSFRRITLAPLLVLGGFAFEIYAIMKKPKKEE